MEPLLVIRNSAAGDDHAEDLTVALSVLRASTSVEVAATGDLGELDGVLHRAGSRRIVVAGGDGSMHAVVAQLARRNELKGKVLGLVPLGTGNDFARGLGIPLEPAAAAEIVLAGDIRPVDLVVDEVGEVVVNNVHVGIGAQASRRGHRWKHRLKRVQLGKLGYPIGAVLSTFQPPSLRLHVEVDGAVLVDVDRPVFQVSVGNGSHIGGGTAITPHADPEDGRLDVMVATYQGPLAKLSYVASLQRGDHPERADVLYARGHEVSVSGQEFWCSSDGEIYGPERSRTWHLEQASYQMTLPA